MVDTELEDGPDVEPESDIAKLVKRGDIQKIIQSEADKRARTLEKSFEDKYAADVTRLEEEYVKFDDEREAKRRQPETQPMGFEKQVQGRTKQQVVEYFEQDKTYGKLGTNELARLVDEVSASDGSLEDLYRGMATSLADKTIRMTAEVVHDQRDRSAEVDEEANRVSKELLRRSEAADRGETAVGAVSGGWSTKIAGEDKSWDQIEEGYGKGDVTREEFENARREHDKERGMYVDSVKEDE